MRILHTSDWHLGQNFYSKSRAAEHQAFLDWLLASAQEHDVDAIIVAGDIFDTGSPPSYTIFKCKGEQLSWEYVDFGWSIQRDPEDVAEVKKQADYDADLAEQARLRDQERVS